MAIAIYVLQKINKINLTKYVVNKVIDKVSIIIIQKNGSFFKRNMLLFYLKQIPRKQLLAPFCIGKTNTRWAEIYGEKKQIYFWARIALLYTIIEDSSLANM